MNAQNDTILAKTPVRIGLVGCGRLAEFGYIPAFRRAAGVVLAGLADVSPTRCSDLAPQVPAYKTVQDLIEGGGVDAIIVSTPTRYHLAGATAAAQAKLPALVEKPPGWMRERPKPLPDSFQDHGLRSTGASIRISRDCSGSYRLKKRSRSIWNFITEDTRGTPLTCRTMHFWIWGRIRRSCTVAHGLRSDLGPDSDSQARLCRIRTGVGTGTSDHYLLLQPSISRTGPGAD